MVLNKRGIKPPVVGADAFENELVAKKRKNKKL